MTASGMQWPLNIAIATLLLAGLPRLISAHPARRAVAVGHCAAAAALAVELDAVEALATAAGATAAALAVQGICLTAVAGAIHALARRISPAPQLLSMHAVAAYLPVIVVQGVFVHLAAQAAPDGQVPLDLDAAGVATPPQVIGFWVVGVAAVGVAVVRAARVFWGPWPRLDFAGRVAVGGAGFGVVLAAGDALISTIELVQSLLASSAASSAASASGELYLSATGLFVAATGTIVARLATLLAPAWQWVFAHIAWYRLGELTEALLEAAPEWKALRKLGRWSRRKPAVQLAFRLATIRTAQFTLMGYVDAVDVWEAYRFASTGGRSDVSGHQLDGMGGADRRRAPDRPALEVSALADACWLRLAVVRQARGQEPTPGVFEDLSDRRQKTDPLLAEASALLAVAAAWHHPLAVQFARQKASHSSGEHVG